MHKQTRILIATHKSDFIATAENKKRAKEDVDLSPAEKELFQDDDDDETWCSPEMNSARFWYFGKNERIVPKHLQIPISPEQNTLLEFTKVI